MESSGSLSQVQSDTFKKYLNPIIGLRTGQRRLFEMRAIQTLDYTSVNKLHVVLPTGYGKTLSAVGDYLICREIGLVDRLLVLVPTDEQRKQWSRKARENAADLGHAITGALQFDKHERAIKHHQAGRAEIFVASYQQMLSRVDGVWLGSLMETGNWMIVFDEFHHLAEERSWGREAARLQKEKRCRAALYLSATPIRTDRKFTTGGGFERSGEGEWEFKADVFVSLEEALKEEAIRKPVGRIQHYFVDVLPDGDDTPIRITTEMLREANVTDFSAFEAKRRLRYVSKYLSKMLLDAVSSLHTQNLEHPGQHQMLVFAMSCNHAEAVTLQLNAIAGPDFADWIGVNRPEHVNQTVLDRYKNNNLQCLVQIDKAGEGFDNERSSVLVFLHLIKSGTKIWQQIGRGLRRNSNIENFAEDICIIFASADTVIAELIASLELSLSLSEGEERDKIDDREESEWPLIPELMVVDAIFDRTDLVGDIRQDPEAETLIRMAITCGAPASLFEGDSEWLRKFRSRLTGNAATTGTAIFDDETAKIKYFLDRCERAAGTFACQAARLYGQGNGGGFEKTWIGDFKKLINGRWKKISGKGHDAMMADDFRQKYEWLRSEYEAMRDAREMPSWLRLW
jgi:superfamily II DNA or RNA helicase